MKKISIILAMLSTPFILWSQGVDEAYLFAKENSFGTARSVGMGNAFGALGGDASAITINPAGVAVYRASEFTFTPSLQYGSTSTKYYNTTSEDNSTRFTINQMGFVGVNQPVREATTGVISTNFGLSFQRTNDFNSNTQFRAKNNTNSLIDQMAYESEGVPVSKLDPYRSKPAYQAYLLDTVPGSPVNAPSYYSAFQNYDRTTNNIFSDAPNGVNIWEKLETTGAVNELSGSGGVNIGNKVFIGGSLNVNFLQYNVNSTYSEMDPDGSTSYLEHFDYKTKFSTNGLGLNLKVGIIYKPINAIRLAASFHTPTWYAMSDTYEYSMSSYLKTPQNPGADSDVASGEFNYSYKTPYKLVASAAFILGEKVALAIDYKYIDYSFAKYNTSANDYNQTETINNRNELIKNTYRATNNLNAGIEFKPISNIALRGGFIYNQNGIKNDKNNTLTYSAGFGYRNKNYFLDFAYRLQQYKSTYYLYQEEGATITNNTSLAAVTLGVKF